MEGTCFRNGIRCVMRALRAGVTGAFALGFSGYGAAEPAKPVAPTTASQLIMVVDWQIEPTERMRVLFEAELGELISSLGIPYQFSSVEEAEGRSFPGRILILRILRDREKPERGSARLHGTKPRVPPKALAWAHVNDDGVAPFGAVDMVALERFLGIPRNPTPPLERAMARAMARVAAHEVYHMLTRSMTHSNKGVMKPWLGREELTGPVRPEWTTENRRRAQEEIPGISLEELISFHLIEDASASELATARDFSARSACSARADRENSFYMGANLYCGAIAGSR